MIRFFLGNRIIALFFIPVIIGSFYLLNGQLNYYDFSEKVDFGLWTGLFPSSLMLSRILAFILVTINAVFLNFIYNKHEFQDRNSYIVSLLYVISLSFYFSFYRLDGILLSHFFIIACLYQFFLLKQNEDGKMQVFNGAFYAGIAASLHPPLLLFFPVFIVMFLIIRPFIFRELILFMTGYVCPLLFGAYFLIFHKHHFDMNIIFSHSRIHLHKDFIVSLSLCSASLLLSLIGIRERLITSSNRLKKQIQMIWLLVIISVVIGGVDYIFYQQIERFSLLMIPLSILLSFSFLNKRFGIMASVLFYLTIGYAVLKFFVPQIWSS